MSEWKSVGFVSSGRGDQPRTWTYRMKVPGGWLYRCDVTGYKGPGYGIESSMVFVADSKEEKDVTP